LAGGFVLLDKKAKDFSPELKNLANQWAYQGERITHGNPSGIDNTVSCYGGIVAYKKGGDPIFLPRLPNGLRIMIVNTRVPRDTKRLVSAVGKLREEFPSIVNPIITSIDSISLQFIQLIKSESNLSASDIYNVTRQLIPINHYLLLSLGVGHNAIDKVITLAHEVDLPAKITGAGGGGCVYLLLPPFNYIEESVIKTLKSRLSHFGFEGFECTFGQDGLLAHDVKNINKSKL